MLQHVSQRKEEANRRKHKGQTGEKEQTQRIEERKNDKQMSGRKEGRKEGRKKIKILFSEFNGTFAEVFCGPENV